MCGICGKQSPRGVTELQLRTMLGRIVHRGPDGQGTHVEGTIGLGSCRLSIIDVAGGHQPISNEDGSVWIVYNGEIYNHEPLRDALRRRGHRFATGTDTEVVVHLYEELGDACVNELNGMFAFALWDAERRRLLLARDRIGQKPLYHATVGGDFLFASEIKGILADAVVPREIDYEALHHYLSLRFIPPPLTMFRSVRKLPAGHLLVRERGGTSVAPYWHLSFRSKVSLSPREYRDRAATGIADAVRSHLRSDVPVGAFLSGGMDSSMVAAVAARDAGAMLPAFTVGVAEADYSEVPFARAVAAHLGSELVESRVDPQLLGSLPHIIWHMDEPSDPIAACMDQAAALASSRVKVVLGGDGGDELFAGFDRYLGILHLDKYLHVPALLRRLVVGSLARHLPDSFTYKSAAQKIRWLHRLSMLPGHADRYAAATTITRFDHHQKEELFDPGIWRQLRDIDAAEAITREFDSEYAGEELLDRMLYADFKTRLPEHTLMLTDRMTMAHGLEARSPYLDHELVELLATFPPRLKIRGTRLKYLMREIAEDYLPPGIVGRPKQGFMFPVAHWFQGPLYPFLQQFFVESALVRSGLFNRRYVERLLTEHRARSIDHHVRLWMLINVELWHRLFIDGESRSAVQDRLEGLLPRAA